MVSAIFECYEDFQAFIGERITKLRNQNGISAREMSLSIGQCAGYINNLENKNNVPSMKGLYYICEFLKISPKDFFDEEAEAPALLLELITELKRLDEQTMQNLLEFVKKKK